MTDPIQVNAGFGWTAAGAWTAAIALLGIIARQVNPWRKQTIEADQQLRGDLMERVVKLERALDEAHVRHEAERALDRHRLNNALQCLDALFLMFETAPERASEVIAKVKEMRGKQLEAEAIEKGAIHAAAIRSKSAPANGDVG